MNLWHSRVLLLLLLLLLSLFNCPVFLLFTRVLLSCPALPFLSVILPCLRTSLLVLCTVCAILSAHVSTALHRTTALCCTALCCTVLYCLVLYCVVLYCAKLSCAVLCCAALYCTALLCCAAMLYCTVWCCAVWCCTVLCCAVLLCWCCAAILRCAVLCRAVLYRFQSFVQPTSNSLISPVQLHPSLGHLILSDKISRFIKLSGYT